MSKEAITPSYVFDASAKTVDLSALAGFDIKKLAAIVNVASNESKVIYAAGCPEFGYTNLAAGVLTLVYDTTTMDDTDELQIIYYQDNIVDLSSTTLAALETINVVQSGSWSVSLTGTNTVELSTASLNALENITVSLDAGSLSALENITIDNITGEVEIKNDSGNPIPISDGGGSITVDGPLTDAQLRAAVVPVSLTSTTITNFPATQPVSAVSLPLPAGASTSALQTTGNSSLSSIDTKLTDGTQKSIVRGGVKGTTTAADVTSTNQSADRQALDVQIRTSSGAAVDSFGGGSQYSQSTVYNGTQIGTMAMAKYESTDPYIGGLADQSLVPLTVDSTGKLFVSAQGQNQFATLAALNNETNARCGGMPSARFELIGSLVGTVTVETTTNNGSSWNACPYIWNLQTASRINNGQITESGNYIIFLGNTNDSLNITNVRARVSAYTSGSSTGYISTTYQPEGRFVLASGVTTPTNSMPNPSNTTQSTDFQMVWNGTTWDRLVGNSTLGVSQYFGKKQTYSQASLNFAPAASATDIWEIRGSATKTVTIKKIGIDATQTSSGTVQVVLLRRSTASTGSPQPLTECIHDSNNAAPTAVVSYYLANPSALGTLVGNIRNQRLFVGALTVYHEAIEWDFGDDDSQGIVLRGTNQVLAVNLGGVSVTGGLFNVYVEWTEE